MHPEGFAKMFYRKPFLIHIVAYQIDSRLYLEGETIQYQCRQKLTGQLLHNKKACLLYNYNKSMLLCNGREELPVSMGLSVLRLSVLPWYGCPPRVIRTGCSDKRPALTDLRRKSILGS